MTARRVARLAATACLVVFAGFAVHAQEPVVLGTIDATVDGEAQRWYQIELQGDEDTTPLSSWSRIGPTTYDVTLQGFIEPRFMLERTIAISLSLVGGLPTDCPCRYDTFSSSIVYLVDGSMTERLYVSDEGGDSVVVIEAFEPAGDGTYRVEGRFEASLPFVADMRAGPDRDDVVDIVGGFVVDHLPEETFE